MPFADPITHVPVDVSARSATDADNRLWLDLAAAYVQDQIVISRYVQAIAGVGYDHFGLRYHNNRDLSDLRADRQLVSPTIGLIVKPVERRVDLRKLFSVSYLPSAGDQFASLTSVTEQVKPEKFQNYEVGR